MPNQTPITPRYANDTIAIPGDLKPYIPGFLERRDHDLKEMRRLIIEENYVSLGTIAHKLKGTGTSYGFPAISALGSDLGDAVKDKNQPMIRQLIEDFADLVDDIKKRLNR